MTFYDFLLKITLAGIFAGIICAIWVGMIGWKIAATSLLLNILFHAIE